MSATRREAIAAIATASVIATVPAVAVAEPTVPVSADRTHWDALVRQRDELREALQRHSARLNAETPKSEPWKRMSRQEDALAERLSHLEDRMLDTPAPDGDALMWKIENFFGPSDTVWAEGFADQFYADARRLLAGRA